MKKQRFIRKAAFSLAAEEGFEPSQTESESVVLPLHNSAVFSCLLPCDLYSIQRNTSSVKHFFQKFLFFYIGSQEPVEPVGISPGIWYDNKRSGVAVIGGSGCSNMCVFAAVGWYSILWAQLLRGGIYEREFCCRIGGASRTISTFAAAGLCQTGLAGCLRSCTFAAGWGGHNPDAADRRVAGSSDG